MTQAEGTRLPALTLSRTCRFVTEAHHPIGWRLFLARVKQLRSRACLAHCVLQFFCARHRENPPLRLPMVKTQTARSQELLILRLSGHRRGSVQRAAHSARPCHWQGHPRRGGGLDLLLERCPGHWRGQLLKIAASARRLNPARRIAASTEFTLSKGKTSKWSKSRRNGYLAWGCSLKFRSKNQLSCCDN